MQAVVAALGTFYGPLAAPPAELFAFFVWEIVSARALPARRDIAWQALRRLPALTPDAMFRASKGDLKAAIDGLGAVEERLDALRAGSGHFRRHRDLAEIVAGALLPAARAVADIPHLPDGARLRALFFAGGHAVAAADDAVARVVARLCGATAPVGAGRRRHARQVLGRAVGADRRLMAQALVSLGHHAGHACLEHAPHCAVCPLKAGCAFAVSRAATAG